MSDAALRLDVLAGELAVARLDPVTPLPGWAAGTPVCAIVRTAEELSVVCPSANIPEGVRKESGFRAFSVRGPLDFGATGVISSLSAPLALAQIPIFVLSSFDTDYLLIRERHVAPAIAALRAAGHEVFTTHLESEVV